MWVVAAVLGVGIGLRLTRAAGLPHRESLIALCLSAVVILAGSKLLFLIEHALFPLDDPVPVGQNNLVGVFRHGFRIPGGLLLLAAVLPAMCRAYGLDTRRFADAIMPAVGIAVICIRVGCFLNGCCFGGRTDGAFGLSFPAGSRVYEYQLLQNDIAWPAQYSLPVHPLQLYFVLLGLLMYVFGVYWQRTKRFDGEVWANVYMLFFGGTFLLEFARAAPLHLNLMLTSLTVALTAVLAARARHTQIRTAPLTS